MYALTVLTQATNITAYRRFLASHLEQRVKEPNGASGRLFQEPDKFAIPGRIKIGLDFQTNAPIVGAHFLQ